MIHYPVRDALALGASRVVVVLGHQRDQVEAYLRAAFPDAPITTVLQEEQLGTAHAVLCAAPALDGFDGDVFILSGDVPTLPREVLEDLDRQTGEAVLGVLGMRLDDPGAYGRLVRDGADELVRIVEARDCDEVQREIREVNAGVYRVDADFLLETLGRLGRDNAQGEYYLTDLVEAAAKAGRGVQALVLDGDAADLAHGVNDRADLARAEARMQARVATRLMRSGVTIVDPGRVWLHDGVEVGPDTVIEPDVSLLGATRVGAGCVLEQGVRLSDTLVEDGAVVHAHSVADRARIGPRCSIGPFARLREGTALAAEVRIGNFVETKKAEMGEGAKANHLAYLGDVTVGAGANIGAGTITCNYDGVNKFKTTIGAGAFIGSDTQLVAPVNVGEGAMVGAGTTVTADVPAGALALSRVRQQNIEGWVARRRGKKAAARQG
jgi:bifunctional UDP-N-acetylglucosamine pyrophosphorylase/glucosamine-1-phosphate N-acetyltransferase